MECPTNQPRPKETEDARVEAPAAASSRVRCILALPASVPHIPADLAEAFAARNIEVRECRGSFRAMALLMQAARQEELAIALVVVEQNEFNASRAEELLKSAGKYVPRAARWMYSEHLSPRLQKWTDPPAPPAPKVNGIRDAIRDTTGQPALRLTGHAEAPSAPNSPPESTSSDAELTPEELAMLLGQDAPDEVHPERQAGEHVTPPPPYDQTNR